VKVPVILLKWRLFTPFRDLLHAANLRHGANGFTSLPKEGMLRIRPGANPRSWVTEASMLTTRPSKPLYTYIHLN
jgi:hypothetical protein